MTVSIDSPGLSRLPFGRFWTSKPTNSSVFRALVEVDGSGRSRKGLVRKEESYNRSQAYFYKIFRSLLFWVTRRCTRDDKGQRFRIHTALCRDAGSI
jgi:hypothetical protein